MPRQGNFRTFLRALPSPNSRPARAADLRPIIEELQATGATSLRAIAAGLNARGIPTARGSGEWSAVQVARALDRIGQ
jgi:hypothetical protein